MRSDIVPGGPFPDYELPDHTGTLRKLSELQLQDVDDGRRSKPILADTFRKSVVMFYIFYRKGSVCLRKPAA